MLRLLKWLFVGGPVVLLLGVVACQTIDSAKVRLYCMGVSLPWLIVRAARRPQRESTPPVPVPEGETT
jgi:hypothetical protein